MKKASLLLRRARTHNPMPWSYTTGPQGLVALVDATGKEVPLMFLLDTMCALSQDIAEVGKPAADVKPP